MMKHLFSFLLIMTISLTAFCQNQNSMSVYFETDQHDLKEKYRLALDDFAKKIPSLTDYSIEILAHTDNRGSLSYNKALANRRAKAVETYLAEKGIIINKVAVNSFGESQPKFSNNNTIGRQQNRRVDIIVQPIKIKKATSFKDINPVLSELKEEARQTFTLKTDQKNVIKAKKGTIITIPPDAFEYKNGSNQPIEEVTISLEEAYSFGDLVVFNLQTVSDGKMLETGGSIRIEASSNGKPLKIKEGKSFNLKMPVETAQTGMELFIGEKNPVDNNVNWKATNKPFTIEDESENDKDNALKSKREWRLPVVLNENGEINREATDKLYKSDKDIVEINEDYVPLYDDIKVFPENYANGQDGSPLIMGYILKTSREAWDKHWDNQPRKTTAKKIFVPKAPKKPNRDSVEYKYFSRMDKLRLGKKGIKAKNDALYERKMGYYENKLKRYNKKKALQERYIEINKKNNAPFRAWESERKALLALILKDIIWNEAYNERRMFFKSKEERISTLETKLRDKGQLKDYELRYYVMDINQMGYINCDKFLNIPFLKQKPIMVKQDAFYNAQTMVIVHRYKSLLNMNSTGNIHQSPPVPNNIDITILSFYTKNGEIYFGKKITKSGAEDIFQLDYQPINLLDLKKELEI